LRSAEADKARTIYAVLFPSRLKFTRLPYKHEWAEADARLMRIAKDGFDKQIEQLGGKLILEHLRETHRLYGEALGITVEGEDPAQARLREPLNLFLSKVRAYVLAVAAHADDADEQSVTLTDALLAPLHQWKSRPTEPAAMEEAPVEPPAPAASAVTASPNAVTAGPNATARTTG
jgi:hypothetical protein